MTDRTQFEAMLEALINEDQETAKEIFHNIVVAKSREIYEQLLSEDFDLNEKAEEEEEESVDEAAEEDSSDDDSDVGGDATDDFIDDVEDEEGADDMAAGDEGGEEEIEDRVMDLEDALEELKAEFEQLMAGEEAEGHHDDMGGMDDMDDMDDMGGMDSEEDDMFAKEMSQMMEYVNKVSPPKHGDNGTNAKSIVASKNDMGGSAANIVRGDTENGVEANKGNLKGNGVFKGGPAKEDNAGNVNVPGAKSATKLSNVPSGHGAEKKGKGEQGAYTKPIVGGK